MDVAIEAVTVSRMERLVVCKEDSQPLCFGACLCHSAKARPCSTAFDASDYECPTNVHPRLVAGACVSFEGPRLNTSPLPKLRP